MRSVMEFVRPLVFLFFAWSGGCHKFLLNSEISRPLMPSVLGSQMQQSTKDGSPEQKVIAGQAVMVASRGKQLSSVGDAVGGRLMLRHLTCMLPTIGKETRWKTSMHCHIKS